MHIAREFYDTPVRSNSVARHRVFLHYLPSIFTFRYTRELLTERMGSATQVFGKWATRTLFEHSNQLDPSGQIGPDTSPRSLASYFER